jgi:hypothetical protein
MEIEMSDKFVPAKVIAGPQYPLTGEITIADADKLGWCSKSKLSELCRTGKVPCRRANLTLTFIKIEDLQRKFGEKPPGINRRKIKSGLTASINEPVAVKTASHDDVPQMTKEDRRIIFSEIDNRYYDETRGYQKGWSDESIATSLNVPRAWVSSIREDNFGPERGDTIDIETINVRDAINEAEKLMADTKQLLSLVNDRLAFFVKYQADVEQTAKNISETIEKARNSIKSFIDMRNN